MSNIRNSLDALEVLDRAADVAPRRELAVWCHAITAVQYSLQQSRDCLAMLCEPWFDDSAFGSSSGDKSE